MICQRCAVGSTSRSARSGKVKMRASSTVHHKRRKWICPKCGRARMEAKARRGSHDRQER